MRDWVAIILAFGLCVAVLCFTSAVLWDALHSEDAGLSDNATQVLTMAIAGMIGLIGGYLGAKGNPDA